MILQSLLVYSICTIHVTSMLYAVHIQYKIIIHALYKHVYIYISIYLFTHETIREPYNGHVLYNMFTVCLIGATQRASCTRIEYCLPYICINVITALYATPST